MFNRDMMSLDSSYVHPTDIYVLDRIDPRCGRSEVED